MPFIKLLQYNGIYIMPYKNDGQVQEHSAIALHRPHHYVGVHANVLIYNTLAKQYSVLLQRGRSRVCKECKCTPTFFIGGALHPYFLEGILMIRICFNPITGVGTYL